MRPGLPAAGKSGVAAHLPASRLPVLLLAVVLVGVGIAALGVRERGLQAEVRRLQGEVRSGAERERALEATVARQHEALQKAEGELEMLRFQMSAVELQLDGVDFLGQQVRAELGLPGSATTWSDAASMSPPQGGGVTAGADDRERLSQAQHRLAAGLADLYQLLAVAEARRANGGAVQPAAAPEPELASASEPPANWPARGEITSEFGWRIYRGLPNFHTGIDIALPYGSQVLSTGAGLVLGSGWQPGYGWSVLVQHGLGYNTLYAHLSETWVSVGGRVKIGDVVGLSGSSGNSTGPHLHYEIWQNGHVQDPRPLMDGAASQ